jgi:hypothetical protein
MKPATPFHLPPFTSHLPKNVNLATHSICPPFTSHLPKNMNLASHSIYPPFTSHLPKNVNLASRSIYPHLPDNVNLATRSIYLPFTSHLLENQGVKMWSYLLQNHSKCFIDTSLHIIKCWKYKMFHNFLRMFHIPPIYPKISDFQMWSDCF